MPYTTSVAGHVITASWANANIRDQVITPFADASTRSSSITSPVFGLHTFLQTTHVTDYYSTSSPAGYYPVAPVLTACKASGADVTSSGSEVALTAWASGDATVTFVNGHLYRFELLHREWNTGTAGDCFDNLVRVRKTVNSTAAQQLAAWRAVAGGGSSPIINQTHMGYVQNVSGADITDSLGLTVEKITGGDAKLSSGAQLLVYDLGEIARVTAAALTALAPTSIV
jgi:hypothetical protein